MCIVKGIYVKLVCSQRPFSDLKRSKFVETRNIFFNFRITKVIIFSKTSNYLRNAMKNENLNWMCIFIN